jgi:hypothetical protein
MDTTDSRGNRSIVTGNTGPQGPAAKPSQTSGSTPRPLYRPATNRDRPPLSIVTPEYAQEEELQDTAKVTREIDLIEAPDLSDLDLDDEPVAPTAKQRIQQARAQRRPRLLSLSRMQLITVLAVALLLLAGGVGALILTRPPADSDGITVPGAIASPSVAANVTEPTPTGIGDPTPTVINTPEPTPAPPPPTDRIAVGGWVQVNSANGLSVRETPSTSGRRITVLRSGAKAHVVGGPEEANGFTWWQIDRFDPNDPEATGWSAANFMSPTTPPEE